MHHVNHWWIFSSLGCSLIVQERLVNPVGDRLVGWQYVFLVCAAGVALNFIPLLMFREPARQGADRVGPLALLYKSIQGLLEPRLFFFTISFAGFWLQAFLAPICLILLAATIYQPSIGLGLNAALFCLMLFVSVTGHKETNPASFFGK